MRTKSLLSVAVVLGLLLTALPAHAVNFHGKIKLVQVTGVGLRFQTASPSVSLFATGDAKEVMIQAFYKKATLDIAYNTIACPAGITGTCGNVTFVSVNDTGLP